MRPGRRSIRNRVVSTTSRMSIMIAAMLLSACASPPASVTRLDAGGRTVVTLSDTILLARPVPTLAVGARDYAYIGPVEINRMGNRRHYFWLGLASTIDRARAGIEPAIPVALVLLVDGTPMRFPLDEWTIDFDAAPYTATTPVYATLSAPASLDQIRRISAAAKVEAQLLDDDGNTARYRAWQGDWAGWATFADGG